MEEFIGQNPTSIDTDSTDSAIDLLTDEQNDISNLDATSLEGRPFQQASGGSVNGSPIGIKRKYFDKGVTEFRGLDEGVDQFRNEIGSEWLRINYDSDGFDEVAYSLEPNVLFANTFQLTSKEHGFPIEVKVEPLDFGEDPEKLYRRQERMTVKISKAEFNAVFGAAAGNKTFFDWFGDVIHLGHTFSDNVFEMSLPMNKRTTENFNFPTKVSTAEFKGNYNYEIPNYEEQIKDVNESLIQNIYALFSAIEYKDTSQSPSLQGYVDHATLGGKVEVVLKGLLKQNSDFDFRDASYSLYLEAWSRAMKILKTTETGLKLLERLDNKFDHMVFPQSEKEIFNAFGDLIELMPMYVEMELSTDSFSPMAIALEEMKLSLAMMTSVIINDLSTPPKLGRFVEVQDTTYATNADQADAETFVSRQAITEWERDSWDLVDWFRKYKATTNPLIFFELFEEGLAFLGDGELEFKVAMTPENNLYRQLLMTIFESKLRGLVKDKFRSYKDILSGHKCSSETLVYRITKWSVNGDIPGNLIQSFWIPNTGDLDLVKFYDTQVKYNKKYIYQVDCYQMVYGTDYKYNLADSALNSTDTDYLYTVTVESTPNIKLWEVPYYNMGAQEETGKGYDVTKVTDDPPIFPDVEFLPYLGVNNKLLVRLNTNNGEYEFEPKFINHSELSAWQDIADSQFKKLTFNEEHERFLDVNGDPQTVTFESDDSPQLYEAYRTKTKPLRYSDFSEKILITLEPPISSFKDTIVPNQTYWYVFRIIDSHGHYSNPTDVYEVKMIDNSGIVYPEIVIKTIEELQAEQDPKTVVRDAQKYIQIKPALLQRFFEPEYPLDVESAMDVEKPVLGVQKKSVFDNGKKFRIRITSKHTGKKVDINLTFLHEHDKLLFNKKAGKK